jgi:RNA recognition motif-containing protein
VERQEFCTYKFTGQAGGFGFVNIQAQSEVQAAISGINTKELIGRVFKVNDARLCRDEPRGETCPEEGDSAKEDATD